MHAQRRNPRRWKLVVAGLTPVWAAALVALSGGCQPKDKPSLKEMPVATEAEPDVPAGDYRGEAIDGLAESLGAKASQLPGRTADDHRRQMHEFFGDVVQVLPILEGPQPSGAFRQQLRTVQTAQQRLGADAGRVPADPTIDTGLRGTYAALSSIGRDEPYAGQKTYALLEQLGGKIDELDRVPSVGRPYVAADAARLVASTVRHMADRVAGRATDTPATVPSSDVTSVPPGAVDPPAVPTLDPKPPTTPAATPPADETKPAEEIPAEEMPAEETPAEETPAEEMPAEETPAEEMPAEETPAEEIPAEETPAEETPAEEMPAEETPAEETPAQETPAEESPAEEESSGDAPAEEMPAEEGEKPDVAPPETEPPTAESPEVADEAGEDAEKPAGKDAPADEEEAPADENK